ncbi:MAG: hypothetical protein FJY29_05640 [Betaproteobacteria bacterium]|nr:hypothetical protein [Betaproteobacteria bacterium]
MQTSALNTPPTRRILGTLAALAISCTSAAAWAGSWGMLLGYNNPAGSKLGLNFLYQGAPFGFELGIGGLGRTTTTTTTSGASWSESETSIDLWGELDLKYYPSVGLWRPFLEGGLTYSLGVVGGKRGFAAGSPFAGGGLLYSGSTVLFHIGADYKINERVTYASAGFGFRL